MDIVFFYLQAWRPMSGWTSCVPVWLSKLKNEYVRQFSVYESLNNLRRSHGGRGRSVLHIPFAATMQLFKKQILSRIIVQVCLIAMSQQHARKQKWHRRKKGTLGEKDAKTTCLQSGLTMTADPAQKWLGSYEADRGGTMMFRLAPWGITNKRGSPNHFGLSLSGRKFDASPESLLGES